MEMKKTLVFLVLFIVVYNSFSIIAANNIAVDNQSIQSITTVFDGLLLDGEVLHTAELKDGSIVGAGSAIFDESESYYMNQRATGDEGCTAIVFKYNSNGTIAFVKTFGGDGADRFNNIFATSDGGFVATGYSYSFTGGDFTEHNIKGLDDGISILVKYDKNGNIEWVKNGEENNVLHLAHASENGKGEIFVVSYHSDGITPQLACLSKLDMKGNYLLGKEYIVLPELAGAISDLKYLEDGSFLICGLLDTTDKLSVGYLNRYDKNGKLIFAKTVSGNGRISFERIIVTLDNKIVVSGSSHYCTEGKEFTDLNMKLPTYRNSACGIIIKYDMNGNALKGNTFGNYNEEFRTMWLRGLLAFDNGDTLMEVRTDDRNFIDPISNKRIDMPSNIMSMYLYRIDSDLNFKYLYKFESEKLSGNSIISKLADGTIRTISAYSKETQCKVRVLNIVDKYLLEKTINLVASLNKNDYTSQSWIALTNKYNSAITVNKSSSTTQNVVNTEINKLTEAVKALIKGQATNSTNIVVNSTANETSNTVTGNTSQSLSENESNSFSTATSDTISKEINLESNLGTPKNNSDNGKFIWIGFGIFIIIGAGVFFYLIKTKKKNLLNYKAYTTFISK